MAKGYALLKAAVIKDIDTCIYGIFWDKEEWGRYV